MPLFVGMMVALGSRGLASPALAQAPPPGGGAPIPVSVVPVTRRDMPVLLRGLGTVQPYQSVLLRARVDGTLDRVNFTEGQEVKAGDVLAELDPRPYQAALNQASAKKAADEALLTSARADVTRYKNLANTEVASRQKLEAVTALAATLEANIKGDDAAIDTAKLNLEFSRITSPIDGRVGLRLVDPGNFIRSAESTGLVSITQTRPISVVFTVPQDNLPAILKAMAVREGDKQGGGKVLVTASSGDDKTELAKGTLLTPDNTIDPATGTIKLKATFSNEQNTLWPGQFVNARLLMETRKNALTVPTAAVQHGPNGLYVYVVKPDSTIERKTVTVLQESGDISVLAGGIDDNAKVVVAGHLRVIPGSRVAIAEPDTKAPAKPKEAGS